MGYWYQDSVNTSYSHTAAYSYDDVNRLSTAVATGNSTYNLSFGYKGDGSNGQYGNMNCLTNAQTNGPCPNWSFSASSNQLTTSGCTYDAAGNLTTDSSNPLATHTYQWDAEGRVAVVDPGSNPTWSFTYNAVGDRVQWAHPGGTDQHLFDPTGNSMGVYGAYDLVSLGGWVSVQYQGSDTYFNHINHLGSTTAWTDHAGTQVQDVVYFPWGGVWQNWGSGKYYFAEMPYYDTTTSTNETTYRFYSQNLGRWLSSDVVAGNVANPQSLNRYAYVLNNPTTLVDPLGSIPQAPLPCVLECGAEGGGAIFGNDIFDVIMGALEGPGASGFYGTAGYSLYNTPTGLAIGFDPGSSALSPFGKYFVGWIGDQYYSIFHPKWFNTFDEYANWATGIAAEPQNVAYGEFLTYRADQRLNPNRAYQVSAWYQGLELNIQVADVNVMEVPADWALDPFTWTHGGDTSYFDLWSLFDSGHYVFDPEGVQYHDDVFGPLVPFHYLDWAVGTITGPGPSMTFTCQVNVGCQ